MFSSRDQVNREGRVALVIEDKNVFREVAYYPRYRKIFNL